MHSEQLDVQLPFGAIRKNPPFLPCQLHYFYICVLKPATPPPTPPTPNNDADPPATIRPNNTDYSDRSDRALQAFITARQECKDALNAERDRTARTRDGALAHHQQSVWEQLNTTSNTKTRLGEKKTKYTDHREREDWARKGPATLGYKFFGCGHDRHSVNESIFADGQKNKFLGVYATSINQVPGADPTQRNRKKGPASMSTANIHWRHLKLWM